MASPAPPVIKISQQKAPGYLMAIIAIAIVAAILSPFHAHLSSTTVALALLLAVLFIATGLGSGPALLASVLGVACFNFFFLPPIGALTIADPQNWLALTVFLITALTVGQLSARAKRRAEEAESGRREIERLYNELQAAFERESQAEAIRRSERLKASLLDAVTHDLRTPLTSIKASVTTLLKDLKRMLPVTLDDEGRKEFLEVIDEEADRLNRDVESMVELARIEAGAMELRQRWTALDEIVETALSRAEALTQHHRIDLSIEDELPAVRVDAGAIAEVIYTLIDNATKYAPPDSLVRVKAGLDLDSHVRVSVEDEGPGIDPELHERVFEKFFRATRESAPPANRPQGIGMGLAIARAIIEAHGGRIWIENGSSGRGARVAFRIPIGDDDAENETQMASTIARQKHAK
jgi:K+-sensing histidine kinase KdpD